MNLPKRKPTRLKGYDYSQNGKYFITICTHNKMRLLSTIVVGEGFHALPHNTLSPIGIKVEESIKYINKTYSDIMVEKYVIMPNHIHLLVAIEGAGGRGNPPLQNIIGQLKSYTGNNFDGILWQRSYHDHIVRNDNDYKKIWEYIDTNVLRWEKDCFYKKII